MTGGCGRERSGLVEGKMVGLLDEGVRYEGVRSGVVGQGTNPQPPTITTQDKHTTDTRKKNPENAG